MGRGGLPPLRNSGHPWGIPSVKGVGRELLETANDQLRTALGTVEAALTLTPGCIAVFVHPENLGEALRGSPASPWDMKEIRRWASERELHRKAVFQCEFGSENASHPTGLLVSEPLNSRRVHRGWPQLRPSDNRYVGPLPPRCNCDNPHVSLGTNRMSGTVDRTVMRPGFTRWLLAKLLRLELPGTGRHATGTTRMKVQPNAGTAMDTSGSASEGATDIDSPTEIMEPSVLERCGMDEALMRELHIHPQHQLLQSPAPILQDPAYNPADTAADVGAATAPSSISKVHPLAFYDDGEDSDFERLSYTSSPSPTSRYQDTFVDKVPYQAPWCRWFVKF